MCKEALSELLFREATIEDVKQIQEVRHSVKENKLSDPSLVTDEDCKNFLTIKGKGWVCEMDKAIVGFSIVDLAGNNIWALFVKPEYEKKGIGKKLHDIMVDWYFTQTNTTVWLGTSPNTRAASFYRKAGWKTAGMNGLDELKFEMTKDEWLSRH